MTRMLGKVSQPWCPSCRNTPGPDCPDRSKSKRQTKAAEKRALREVVACHNPRDTASL